MYQECMPCHPWTPLAFNTLVQIYNASSSTYSYSTCTWWSWTWKRLVMNFIVPPQSNFLLSFICTCMLHFQLLSSFKNSDTIKLCIYEHVNTCIKKGMWHKLKPGLKKYIKLHTYTYYMEWQQTLLLVLVIQYLHQAPPHILPDHL